MKKLFGRKEAFSRGEGSRRGEGDPKDWYGEFGGPEESEDPGEEGFLDQEDQKEQIEEAWGEAQEDFEEVPREEFPEGEGYLDGEDAPEGEGYLDGEDVPEEEGYLDEGDASEGEEFSEREEFLDEGDAPEEEGYLDGEDAPEEEGYLDGEDAPEEEGYLDGEDAPEEEGYLDEEDAPEEEGYLDGEDVPEEEEFLDEEEFPEEGPLEEGHLNRWDAGGDPGEDSGAEYISGEDEGWDETPQDGEPSSDKVWNILIALGGAAILLLALAVGGILLKTRVLDQRQDPLLAVGAQLTDVPVIGQEGLLAMADAQRAWQEQQLLAQQEAAQTPPPTVTYQEGEYNTEVEVQLSMTSIEKDLKIKFVNKETGKLVGNVPFRVRITGPDGSASLWSDDDMDGIIHKKSLAPGQYRVSVEALEERFQGYALPAPDQQAEVKNEIEYKKVDVSNEVKTESQVNTSQEDTAQKPAQEEEYLPDTVEWVESTEIADQGSYTEVDKSTIPDPSQTALGIVFRRLSQEVPLPDAQGEGQEGQSPEPASEQPAQSPDVVISQDPAPSPASEPVSEASPAPESTAPTQQPGSVPAGTYTAKIDPTIKTVMVGDSFVVTASCDGVQLKDVVWTSSNPALVSVDEAGKVTALDVTTEPVIISYTAGGTDGNGSPVEGLTASCSVLVEEAYVKGTLKLERESLSLPLGKSAAVSASAEGYHKNKVLTYSAVSENEAVATAWVDDTGKVTVSGAALGSTTVTVSVDYRDNPQESTRSSVRLAVTVTDKPAVSLDKTTAALYMGSPLVLHASLQNAQSAEGISAESSDTAVAQVQVQGMDVTVTGSAPGSANITVKYTEGGETFSAVCAVTVKADPRQDTATPLRDNKGRDVYVLENNAYRLAVSADYYTAEHFYIKAEAKLTGWQTENGVLRYYDADGNMVTGQQVIQGVQYNFAADGSLVTDAGVMGIDVSKHNGDIDWGAVKNSGVNFVIIRCGYRGSSQGALIVDPKFAENIQGAQAAGLKVGVYFFTQAIDRAEAVEEASMVLELIKNYTITYPVFLDVEPSGGRGDKLDKAARTDVIKAFCETIQQYGYSAGIYANKTWLTEKFDVGSLGAYKIWLAQYASVPTYTGRYNMWQYKCTGKVSGITGDVDLNMSFLGY